MATSIHPADFYQNKLNSSFHVKCFLLYSLNGTTLLKRKKDFNSYVRNTTLYLQAQNSMHITCQSMVNLSIKTAFNEKDIAQFLQAIFHKIHCPKNFQRYVL
jgi:hypothetical protein